MTAGGLLVPVRDSVTLRNTVAHVAERAAEEGIRSIHFVYPLTRPLSANASADPARDLLDQVAVWADEDLGADAERVTVHTAVIGKREYLFHPSDYARVFSEYASENGLETLVLDPEFNPGGMAPLLPPLENEIRRTGLDTDVAPVERPTQRGPLVRRAGLGQFGVLFGWAYAFYLLIGGSLTAFNLATGALVSAIVATALWRISMMGEANPLRLAGRLARLLLYVPYLLWEIVKSNVHIAYVVLHPSLPIDPKMVEYDAAVFSELQVTTLANSITLTPGTLTVDVKRRHFQVHSLTQNARDGLFSGELERAVRFVYYGRPGARLASPAEQSQSEAEGEEPRTEGETR